MLERRGHRGGVGEPRARIFFERARDQMVERLRKIWIDLAQVRRLLVDVQRDQIAGAPIVATKHAERAHPRQRSWEKEAMIIGGSAGAGTAVGALTGGKKGAGIGAAAGGVGGLIYDLATRKRP